MEEEVKGAQLFALTDVQAKGGKVDKDGLAKRNTMTHLKRCSSGGVLYSSHETVYMPLKKEIRICFFLDGELAGSRFVR